MEPSLSSFSKVLVSVFEKEKPQDNQKKINVNPVVSKFASLYEKLRNAMEYREDEVILRAAIERILKRRLLLGGNAKTTAEPLVRELIWAGYLPNGSVPQASVDLVERSIDLYLELRLRILKSHKISDSMINEWTYHLISSDIEHIVNPNPEKEIISNFMFQILKNHIFLSDDSEQTRDVQVFIVVRKTFVHDDLAFLHYHLFKQFFGELDKGNIDRVVANFPKGFSEITRQLNYPRKDRIYAYVKKKSAAFLILEDVLRSQKGNIQAFINNDEEFAKAVFAACEARYRSIGSKVKRAILRSVVFLLLTKLIIAFVVEGSFERFVYGKIFWSSIAMNTGIPPLLMLIVGLLIRTPNVNNSKRILSYIKTVLYEENPVLGESLVLKLKEEDKKSFLDLVFRFFWVLAFILSFGGIVFVLTKLHFNVVSQLVFIFFLAIVSFLSYRINLTANLYTVEDRENLITPIVDFLFMPIVRVGRHLTQGISQINALLFIFDLFIETPFKLLFGFFEQWFVFLRAKSEEME